MILSSPSLTKGFVKLRYKKIQKFLKEYFLSIMPFYLKKSFKIYTNISDKDRNNHNE